MVLDIRAFVCETRTGKILGDIPVVSPKWGIRLNASGTVTASIPATSREVADLDIKSSTTTLQRSFGIAFGEFIPECGPILYRKYDEKTRRLEITAAGLWSLFDRRKAVPGWTLKAGATQVAGSVLKIGPTSLGSIARELVRVSIEDNPYPGAGALNIALPAVAGGGHVRNYAGYDLRWIGEALRELTKVKGGPDIRFRPRFMGSDPSRVEWAMETGTAASPLLRQTGNDWQWDGSRSMSGVVGFGAVEDATGVAARAWVPGAGQERAMKLRYSTNEAMLKLGWPWTEVDNASKQEESVAVLQALANQDIAAASGPEEQFSITVRADVAPALGSYLPGDFATVVIPDNHPMLNKGPQRVRIMAIDGDATNEVKLTVAPFVGSTYGNAVADKVIVAPTVAALYPSSTLYPGALVYPS